MKPRQCPMCPGHGQPLGALGSTMHYRCRDCGWTFSHTPRTNPWRKSKNAHAQHRTLPNA